MATVAGAFTALATFAGTVSGIVHSYDLGAVPDSLSREKLPCAVIFPQNGEELGFSTLAMLGSVPKLDFSVKQIILVAPADTNPFRKVAPGMLALFDNYLAALKAQPFLGPTSAPPVHEPVRVKPTFGVVEYGGQSFHAIELNVSMTIFL